MVWKKFRTRVIQKVIETINTQEQALKVVSALSPGAMRLMTDPNGSHVINRCLQKLLPEHKTVSIIQLLYPFVPLLDRTELIIRLANILTCSDIISTEHNSEV
jgi:hypothetical protein